MTLMNLYNNLNSTNKYAHIMFELKKKINLKTLFRSKLLKKQNAMTNEKKLREKFTIIL